MRRRLLRIVLACAGVLVLLAIASGVAVVVLHGRTDLDTAGRIESPEH